MNYLRAFRIAFVNWIIGVSIFTLSYFFPFTENVELQANLSLAITLTALGWLGAKFYYRNGHKAPGYALALIILAVTIVLDALITVPVLFLPVGGTYGEFFGAAGFWILVMVYAGMVMGYDLYRRRIVLNRVQ